MTQSQEETRGLWLAQARAVATRIAQEKGTVTVNDVRDHCPPPEGVDPRILGAVFLHGPFTRIGFRNSARRNCHGRPIGIFALRN